MYFSELIKTTREDRKRHSNLYNFMIGGGRVVLLYRIGHKLIKSQSILNKCFLFFLSIYYKHYQYITGIELPFSTNIGKGLIFAHTSNIVIGGNVEIGENCTIFQGVTIGSMRSKTGGTPRIGNNVVIFPGAKIIGNVYVGDNAVIGANSVVVKDVPENAVVAGVPATIKSYKGTEISNNYRVI